MEPPNVDVGFTWGDYVDGLVAQVGSLTAVAERLAAQRAHEEDVASIERALRRLRTRGQQAGGKWGTRLLTLFGLPQDVNRRLRWMAAYHSRFTDLPVPFCEDLIRLWDHPPTNERREGRAWLALARASVALRKNDHDEARTLLTQVSRLAIGPHATTHPLPVEARIEALLASAYLASVTGRDEASELLPPVEALLPLVESADERACLQARWIDQRAYDGNRRSRAYAASEALYRMLPASDAPPFVLSRRANGLAYALWKQGRLEQAAAFAREAAEHAGDGGHVRLRVMALNMVARIDPRQVRARDRAVAIARRLDDETLLARLAHLAQTGDVTPAQS